ncbi:hypothetical protein [Nonomuraea africana]|uniref:Uncharacterized protein n=1 Tax=Nonomuraea africana TaxID=46171 RepID=A0ABR9KML1_9ACTN|nr:hypothetical protein [Nonomuraea africana]MBE1563252.1 hypothetical protein [Nonomuraea africana]
MTASIPVVLVSDIPSIRDAPFHIVEIFTAAQVIQHKGELATGVHIAIVDPGLEPGDQDIISALYLRNAGKTAVVGNPELVPGDLMEPIHELMTHCLSTSTPVQTEVLLMEDAMPLYGDISEIVEAFERQAT